MNKPYSEGVAEALQQARCLAQKHGISLVTSQILLWALFRKPCSIAHTVLTQFGVTDQMFSARFDHGQQPSLANPQLGHNVVTALTAAENLASEHGECLKSEYLFITLLRHSWSIDVLLSFVGADKVDVEKAAWRLMLGGRPAAATPTLTLERNYDGGAFFVHVLVEVTQTTPSEVEEEDAGR